VLLRYQVGSASTEAREQGFLEAARGRARGAVDNRYAGATVGEAKTTALNLLDALKAAQGVFCSNESATAGMLLALEQARPRRQAALRRFRRLPADRRRPEAGKLDAIVVQDPRKMGRLSVELLAKLKRGEPVAPLVDTGAVLVTKDTMSSPDVAPLLQ
jgi:ribose transport system substrate-binding protein